MMHIIKDNEGEERLNQLISAAREEPLLVSTDEVSKSLTSSASVTSSHHVNKPGLSVVYKASIIALIGIISALTIYYFNQKKEDQLVQPISLPAPVQVSETANDKLTLEKVTKTENQSGPAVKTEPLHPGEITEIKKTPQPKESFYFEGSATVVFDYKNKHVEMVAGDEMESLVIDHIKIKESEFNLYQEIIDFGLDLKKEKDNQRMSNTDSKSLNNKVIMQSLIKKLLELQLIQEEEPFDFYLKGTIATLNNKELVNDQFLILKATYEETTGKSLPAAANIHIKH